MGLFSRRKRSLPSDAPVPSSAPVPSAAEQFAELVAQEWARVASPGTWWSGGERLAIVNDALNAAAGHALSGILPGPVEEATTRVAGEAAGIRSTDIDRWSSAGLDPFAYVEIVGLVGRAAAIDTAAFGLGQTLPPLPEAETGTASGEKPDNTEITSGWVPRVGLDAAGDALGAVPAEAEAVRALHESFYLSADDASDLHVERDGLSRPQIELAAARTSRLNGCFACLLPHTSQLRASITTFGEALAPGPIALGVGDTGVPHGREITAFVDSIVLGDADELAIARDLLEDRLGTEATDRVAMIAGSFSMMNRVLCAVGAPFDPAFADLADELGLSVPEHLGRG